MGEVAMADERPLFSHFVGSPMITVVTIADIPRRDDSITSEASVSVVSSRQSSMRSLGGGHAESGPRDQWLPITESREGNGFYAAFHLLCSGVGPQALMLPVAFTFLGWTWGIICLTLAFVWQLYTIRLLVGLHEPEQGGARYSRYLHLSVASFGEKMGKILALFPVMYLSGGTCVMLIITGGQTMELFYGVVAEDGAGKILTGTEWFALFASVAILTALLFPNLNSLAVASLLGSAAAVAFCTVIWVLSIARNRPDGVSHELSSVGGSEMGRMSGVANAVGIVFLAFRGHNLVLEIQGTLPSTSKRPSDQPMLRAVASAYLSVASCLFPLAVAGYWAYGNQMRETGGMLKALTRFHGRDTSKAILAATCLLLVLSCLASFQLYAMPVFDNLEMRYASIRHRKCSRLAKTVVRLLFGGLAFFISFAFPFLPSLGGLIGGISLPLTYAYPCFMWLVLKRPPRFSLGWCVNIFLGGLGMALSVLLVAAALWSLVDQGLDANFFKPR